MARLVVLLMLFAVTGAVQAGCPSWTLWESFKSAYVQADGRVIDRSQADQATVSEGAAYAAFLALAADDRSTFQRIVRWVRDNLTAGDLASRLPAWRWGRRPDGSWDVIDDNSASDADVWLAYTLLEAGRLWHDPTLSDSGRQLAQRVLADEVVTVPGIGAVLLPGKSGFAHDESKVTVNPSYAPSFILQRLRAVDQRYASVLTTQERMMEEVTAYGFVPDWAQTEAGVGFVAMQGDEGRGAYNALRVYLWTAMEADSPSHRRALIRLKPFADHVTADELPEWFDPRTGASGGIGGRAHRAAILPLLHSIDPSKFPPLSTVLPPSERISMDGQRYYGDVLTLLALGAESGRISFGSNGQLRPREVSCRF